MIYWDELNGRVETECKDENCALIYDAGGIYKETYEINGRNLFDISYTEITKQTENMYYYRKNHCEESGINYSALRKLIRLGIPSDKYKELLEIYDKNKSEVEE